MKIYQVSIVIINFNSSSYIIPCIESIQNKTSKNFCYQIVIIDNASLSSDFEKLNNFTQVQENIILFRSKINLGFSGANMLAVQLTNAEYIYFLNPDTILLNDCLTIFYNFMNNNPEVGICTGQMYNTDMSFCNSFGYFPTVATKFLGSAFLRFFNPEKYPRKNKEYSTPLKVDFITGSAMFISYNKFAQIGGFDTNYFLYNEEEDISFRFKKAGYSAYVVPEAKFIHHMGKSTKRNYLVEKEGYISKLYFHRKNNNYLIYTFMKAYYFIKTFKKFYKNLDNIKLAFFILSGAHLNNSMKHQQTLSSLK